MTEAALGARRGRRHRIKLPEVSSAAKGDAREDAVLVYDLHELGEVAHRRRRARGRRAGAQASRQSAVSVCTLTLPLPAAALQLSTIDTAPASTLNRIACRARANRHRRLSSNHIRPSPRPTSPPFFSRHAIGSLQFLPPSSVMASAPQQVAVPSYWYPGPSWQPLLSGALKFRRSFE